MKSNPWKSIKTPTDAERLAAVSVNNCIGLKWIKSSENRLGLAVELANDHRDIRTGTFKHLEFEVLNISSSLRYFCVFCTDQNYLDLFEELCHSLIQNVSHIYSLSAKADAVVKRAEAWAEFLKKGRKSLTREQILGLFCELSFMAKQWLTRNYSATSWTGPDKKAQDFVDQLGNMAVEIKHISGEDRVKISSIYQLDYSGSLYLYGIQLETSDEGTSLNGLIKTIKSELNHDELLDFETKLIKIGYEESSAYDELFLVRKQRMFTVNESFPKIVPGQDSAIVGASYSLDLNKLDPRLELDTEQMESAFGRS